MRLGLSSPIVVQVPAVASAWEHSADVDALVTVARTADTLGFEYLTCSEHVAVPDAVAEQRGATYWDPLATLAYLAGHTSRIRLVTSVLVLGYHHPLAVAKRYGTLDRLSKGRVVLGFGVGSLREEFDLLGAVWDDRGAVADDALRALRAAMSARSPRYHGTHFGFDGMVVEPHAVQHHVPFWVGGRSARSLRRAIELADGWAPFGLSHDELAAMLGPLDLPHGFEVVLSPAGPLDPQGHPDAARRALARLREAGATLINAAVRATSLGHYCDQLDSLRTLADDMEP